MYNWTNQDLKKLLNVQIHFLQNSNSHYDEGYRDEYLRLATTLRVLLYDYGKSSISLFKHLSIKSQFQYISTHDESQISNQWPSSLTTKTIYGSVKTNSIISSKIVPRLSNFTTINYLDFTSWWNEEVIIINSIRLSREKIIKDSANQLGGTHVKIQPNSFLIGLNSET